MYRDKEKFFDIILNKKEIKDYTYNFNYVNLLRKTLEGEL